MSGERPPFVDPRRVLRRHGLAPKRGFSQNFLISRHAVERIVAALAPAPGEPTVELGPGLGTLTAALCRAGAAVIAVERDRDMLRVLSVELGDEPHLELREGDASTLDLSQLASERGPLAVVGNLPYAVTGAILRNLVSHREAFSRAVLMVQREVRDRLLAPPGSKTYGASSVFVQAAFDVAAVLEVPPGAFHPPPKVRSSVIRLAPPPTPRAAETPTFRAVVKAAFGQRRKTLRNALSSLTGREELERALREAGVDPGRRAETLTVEDFAALASALEERVALL